MGECLGSTNSVILNSLEVKQGPKSRWGKVSFLIDDLEVRATVFQGRNPDTCPLAGLEAYVVGEEIPNIFGKVATSDRDGKVYTNMQILKVGSETKDKNGWRVSGKIQAVGATPYAQYVDVDTTEGEYASWVRLELPKKIKRNPFRVGQRLRDVNIAPMGKYGTWTITDVSELPEDGSNPAAPATTKTAPYDPLDGLDC